MSIKIPGLTIGNTLNGVGATTRRAVRAATNGNGNLSLDFANGQVLDGVTLATGDRILIKNQTTASNNGIYEVQITGPPVRTFDYAEGEAVASTFILVKEGSTNIDTGWICTNDSPNDIVGTHDLTYRLISGDVSNSVTGVSTDNAIVRWDGTLGMKIQDTSILIDDSNNMTGLQYLQFNDISAPSNPSNNQGRLYKKTGDDGIWWKPDSAGPEVDLTDVGVSTFQTSLAGLTPNTPQSGPITLGGTLGATSGGTGTSTAPTAGQLLVGTSGGAYVPYTVTSGTGISTTTGSGTFQINNTGVTSLTGTTNQVSVNSGTGAVTVSTPSTFIAPGTIQDSTGMLYSADTTVSAAGATQGTATGLTKSYNVVTTVAASTGVRLQTPTASGYRIVVVNKGANPLNIYPDTGGAIDSAGTNVAVVLPVGATITFQAASATQWYTVNPPIKQGAGTNVSYGNGGTTVSAAISPGTLPYGIVTDTIAADQNNYNPVGLNTAIQLQLTPSGDTRSITGLTISGTSSAPELWELKITNVGTQFNLILRHESTSSTAANRFTFDGQDMVLMPGQSCTVWYEWTTARWRGVACSQDGRIGGQQVTAGVITPPSLSTNQNDYNPTGLENTSVIRLAATAIVSITGLAGGFSGRRIVLVNIGTLPITLVNLSGSSLAANRFFTGTSNTTIVGNNSASLIYDGTNNFWRIIAGTGGAITGAGGLIQSQWVEVTTDRVTTSIDWTTYYGLINAAVVLPTGTITVDPAVGGTGVFAASPTLTGHTAALAASVANPQTLIIQTNTNNAQLVTYTGTTATTFTGCTGGSGAISVGNYVWNGPVQTSIAAGSNGVSLPTGTINVVSTTGFPASGTLLVTTSNGTQRVSYTGVTATTFTGCTLGAGVMSTGGMIYNVSAVSPHDLLTINITTSGGALIIIATANASTDSNRTGYFQVLVDGFFRRGGSTQGNGGAPAGSCVVSLKLSNVLAGDHVVTVRWVVEGGDFAVRPVTRSQDNNASLLVQEVSS